MSVLSGEAGLLPQIEKVDQVTVDDSRNSALQIEPEIFEIKSTVI